MKEESVIGELPEDYVRRMRNWARSASGIGLLGISSIYQRERCDGWDTSMPTLMGEASDTHAALSILQPREYQAVTLFWENEGKGLVWLGRRLNINDKTAKVRVLNGSSLHQAELRRRSDQHHRMIESNAKTLAKADFSHSRTGAITVRTRVGVDIGKIPR